jgi:hypothetical protein
LLLFVKYILFFAETGDFSPGFLLGYLGFLFFLPEYFSLFLKGFLFKNFRYSVDLANIISLALTNILGAPSILDIARSNTLLFILFITSIRGYISFTNLGYCVIKRNRTTIVTFGQYDKKERKSWPSSDISYIVLKCRDDTNRERNSITSAHVTRGP